MSTLSVEFESSSVDKLHKIIPACIDHYLKCYKCCDLKDEEKISKFLEAFKKVSHSYKGRRVKDSQTGLGESCSICLESFKKNQIVKILCCEHKFHRKCIHTWNKQNSTCPICRSHVL